MTGFNRYIRISNEGEELHFIVEENDVDFKLARHKASIFVLMGTAAHIEFNTPNKGEFIVSIGPVYNTYNKEA